MASNSDQAQNNHDQLFNFRQCKNRGRPKLYKQTVIRVDGYNSMECFLYFDHSACELQVVELLLYSRTDSVSFRDLTDTRFPRRRYQCVTKRHRPRVEGRYVTAVAMLGNLRLGAPGTLCFHFRKMCTKTGVLHVESTQDIPIVNKSFMSSFFCFLDFRNLNPRGLGVFFAWAIVIVEKNQN